MIKRWFLLVRPISAQPLLAMYGSDAMVLSIVVGIPDLVYTYMEPMETASSNLHASHLTYWPQYVASPSHDQTLISLERPISAQPLLAMYGSDAMVLFIVVGIPDLVYTYMEPMETTSSNLHATQLTYWPQCGFTIPWSDVDDFSCWDPPSQLSHSLPCMGVMPVLETKPSVIM